MSAKYVPSEIEPKWQEFWAKEKTFQVGNPGDPGFDASKPKYYILDMFPYPSGAGLHVGHPEGYTATDILARWKRMQGFNVLHPMGWDAYGLPAEQYAVQTGTHPAVTTKNNVANMKRQIQALGFSYDWSREVDTTDPHYYKWTQWIFTKLFNSIYDPRANKARHVNEIAAELNDYKIGVKNGTTLVWDKSAKDAQAAGFGKQWPEMDGDEQWRLLANHRLAYRSGQRRSHRRPQRTRRPPVRQEAAAPMDAAHHRVRRTPAGRSGSAGLAGADQADAAALGGTLRGSRS
jgi:hypothetical protein